MPTTEEKNWAIAAHLGALLAAYFSGGLLQFLVPLAILLVKGDTSAFVAHHARQSLNFQLTLFIAAIAYWVVALVLILGIVTIPITLTMACVSSALYFLVQTGCCIYAAMKANAGEAVGYPALPFLSDPA